MRTSINKSGFTLIEVLLSMGIIAVLFSITAILMLNLIPKATLVSLSEILITELRNQQLKAMVGETGNSGLIQEYGFKAVGDKYILFSGSTYDPGATDNFLVDIEDPLTLETTFSNQEVVFDIGSGEVANFIDGQDTFTLRNTLTGEIITLELNKYGIITQTN